MQSEDRDRINHLHLDFWQMKIMNHVIEKAATGKTGKSMERVKNK